MNYVPADTCHGFQKINYTYKRFVPWAALVDLFVVGTVGLKLISMLCFRFYPDYVWIDCTNCN